MKNQTVFRSLYSIFLCIVLGLLLFFIQRVNWLQTDLTALLPQEQQWSETQIQADKVLENQLNQQVIVLIGHQQPEVAFSVALAVATQWKQTDLFAQIDSQTFPDLKNLSDDIKQLRVAVLPTDIHQQLLTHPQTYFQQYAEQLAMPFGYFNLLSVENDWLGFGRFVLSQSQVLSQVEWNANNGMLFLQKEGKTWVLLRGILPPGNHFIDGDSNLLELIEESRQISAKQQAELLAASPILFATTAKQQAEQESVWMLTIGVTLTLLLLLCLFRTARILWLFFPIFAGMLVGVVATLFWFGQIHILTLVIGTSLIGVLIDFPLHWLVPSLFSTHWKAIPTMNQLRVTFAVSMLITLLGYGLLWFTVLPILQQTAVFSAFALIAAVASTFIYLPKYFQHYQSKAVYKRSDSSHFLQMSPLAKWCGAGIVMVLISIGLYKSKWQDDIRQWVAISPIMLAEAQKVAQLTGIDLGNQYFLIEAENDNVLLQKTAMLSKKLQTYTEEGKILHYQSISQWIRAESEQQALIFDITHQLKADDYAILEEVGIPQDIIQSTLQTLAKTPTVSLQQALHSEFGKGWQSLYLGKLTQDKVATVIKVSGVKDLIAMRSLANQQDIYWQDKRAHLNKAFQQTRDQAIWLKLASFVLAGLLLWRFFGVKTALTMLMIPLMAMVSTVALFGWLNIPISLFTMFGLLLVSAISIDYVAYLHTAKESVATKQMAVLFAALTTMISFILLSLSSTPAIASFGLSVSLGVGLSILIVRVKYA